jgi:hypothetical protein
MKYEEIILTQDQRTIMDCKAIVEYCIRQEAFKENRSSHDANIIGAAFQVVEIDIQKMFKQLFNGVELKNIIHENTTGKADIPDISTD